MFIHESSHDTDCTCVNGTSSTARLKVYWLMMQHCRSSLCNARQHSMRTDPSQNTSLAGCFHLILSRERNPAPLSLLSQPSPCPAAAVAAPMFGFHSRNSPFLCSDDVAVRRHRMRGKQKRLRRRCSGTGGGPIYTLSQPSLE